LPDANVPDFIWAKIFAGDVFELILLFDGAGDGVDTMLLNGDCPNGEKPVGFVCTGVTAVGGKLDVAAKPANGPPPIPVG